MTDLTGEETDSIKKSYLNIVGLFLERDLIESRFLRCLLKWGFQLQLHPDDLRRGNVDLTHLAFAHPESRLQKLETIYHLVHMICLDQVVEDVELEIAGLYAEKLGFKSSLVNELLKSIVTADADGQSETTVREQIMEFLKIHNA
jgi:hypothetical protein